MQQKDYRLAAIMYTDIQGFSRMMEKDEKATLGLLDYHNDLIRTLSARYNGKIIKTIGDALLVIFATTPDAVNCALDVQNTLAEYNTLSGKQPLRLRIGVHLGDIYFYENDALGEGINIASRLQSIAFPGCICVSREVYTNVFNKIHADFKSLGRVNLKNITKEIHAYEIVTANAVDYDRATLSMPDRHERAGGVEPLAEKARETAERQGPRPQEAGFRAAVPPQAPQPPAGPVDEFAELKAFVLRQIKKFGRRMSVERLKATFPLQGESFSRAVEKLADMGFLTREGAPGTAEASREDTDESHEEDMERPRSDSMGMNWDWTRNIERFTRNMDTWKTQAHAFQQAYRDKKRAERNARRHADHAGIAEMMQGIGSLSYAEYKERVIHRAQTVRAGFFGHVIPFLAVNGFLFYINFTTSWGFPWFLFPLFGWGIGIVNHLAAVRTRRLERDDVEALPENLSDDDYKGLIKYHHARSSARQSTASLLAVSALLVMINLVTSPQFPWCAFPIGGLMIGLLSSLSVYLAKRGGLIKRIRNLIKNKTGLDAERMARAGQADDPPIVRQAAALAESVLAQAKGLGKDKAYLGEDLKPLLGNYIAQIRVLAKKSGDVEQIIAAIPHQELDRDLVELRKRYANATSDSLKVEYEKSIDQIERQNKSFSDLKDQKELMDLRIRNSLNSLKQMQIDLARMAGLTTAQEPSSVDAFKEKAHELSQYLEDMEASYKELDDTKGGGQGKLSTEKLLEEFKKIEQNREKELP